MFIFDLLMPKLFMSFAPEGEEGDAGSEKEEKELEDLLGGKEEEGKDEEEEEEGKEEKGKEKDEKKDEKKKEDPKPEDEEFDLKDLGKLKKSELKDLLEKGKDYTKKTQDLSEKEKSVKELQDWAEVVKGNKKAVEHLIKFSSKLMNNKGEYDEELLDRLNNALENKVEGAKTGLKAQEIQLEKELAELDPESPMYKVVKASLDQIQSLQERLDKADKEANEAKERKAQEDYKAQVVHAQQVYRTTLDTLIDEKDPKGLKFDAESSKKIWESLVSSYMKDNPKDYKDEADFVNTLKDVGRACHASLSKFSEEVIAGYLKKKGKPTESEEGESKPKGKKDDHKIVPADSRSAFEDSIAGALQEEMAKT